jgi:hypothetical protein
VGLAFSGNIRAAPIHRNQFRNSAKSRLLKITPRLLPAVPALAVVLRDNSGTGILLFPQLLKPASARAAIPRTSNSLQGYNSWLHRNGRIAFP